jgi:hypothetical protein
VRYALVCWLVLAGCKALPPPPIVPPHAETANSAPDTVTAMVVIGFAGTIFGGGGFGVAVRVERQQTDRTTLGLELGGGRGHESGHDDEPRVNHTLIAVRGYGRSAPQAHDFVALTYGVGLSYLSTGLVTATVHAGAELSYVNDYAMPYATLGFAAAVPLVTGEPFGDYSIDHQPLLGSFEDRPGHMHNYEGLQRGSREGHAPRTELYPYGDAGLVVPLGDTYRASIDFGLAHAIRENDDFIALSLAGGQR